jgi:hypothetical protein
LLVRLSGVALLLSGILATIGFSVHPHDANGSNRGWWLAAHVAVMGGGFLNLLGLVGLYLASATRIGGAGLLGFLLAAASLVLYLGKLYWSAFIYPLVATHDPQFVRSYGLNPGADPVDLVVRIVFYLGPVLFATGYAVLGLGLAKAGARPTAALGTMVVGALLVGLWPLLPAVVQHLSVLVSIVYTVGAAWVGYLLASDRWTFSGPLETRR